MKAGTRSSGVTLIELLIAVSLLGLLSVGMLMAMRVGLNAMDKANTQLMANRRIIRAQRILEEQIAGFMPLVAPCQRGAGQPPSPMRFFQGEPASMRFLSSYSLGESSRGFPQILEFQVIPGENGKGVRLVVNEHLYTGPAGAGFFCLGMGRDPVLGTQVPLFPPIQVGPRSFVLADRLSVCRFFFRKQQPPPELEQWIPHWTDAQWPTAIRIEMASLDDDPAQIQPVALTAPLRVNRVPNVIYAD